MLSLVHATRSACLPYASYEKTGHQIVWFNMKKMPTVNPRSQVTPAETFPPATSSDYQYEFALVPAACHCVTGIFAIQVQRSQMLFQPPVEPRCRLPSPPLQCVCVTLFAVRAAVSRVVLLCDAHTSLAASKRGGGCASLLKAAGESSQRSGGCYQQFQVEAPPKHLPPTGLSQFYRRTHSRGKD